MKTVYQPGKVFTRHNYLVRADGVDYKNFDFIKNSKKFYYYDPAVRIVSLDQCYEVYENWIDQARKDLADFSWDQLCKLPYLYQDLLQNPNLRFPIMMADGNRVTCGTGRIVVIKEFMPHIPVDAVVTSVQPRLDLSHRLYSVKDLEDILLAKPYFSKKGKNLVICYQIHDDYIYATDCRQKPGNHFPFCKDSVNPKLVDEIKTIIGDVYDVKKAIRLICEISLVDR